MRMMDNKNKFTISDLYLRQTYRDEIYNYRPPWVLRWGITVFFLFVVIIIIVSGFIKYPDVVTGTAEITTLDPPINLVSGASGKLKRIFVKEGQMVKKDEVLMVLESSVDWRDITALEQKMHTIDSSINQWDSLAHLLPMGFFEDQLKLGEIQAHYTDLRKSYNELYEYYHLSYNDEKLAASKRQLSMQKDYSVQLLAKRSLVLQQLEIGKKELARDLLLFQNKVISERKLDNSKQENDLRFQSLLADLDLSITSNLSKQDVLKQEIQQFILQDKVEKTRLELQMEKSLQLIKAALDTWKQKSVIISPIDGIVSFSTYWSENQYVSAGHVVASVVPGDSSTVKARVQIPIQNSGKVKAGQRVNIKLASYPHQEYGMLIGQMGSISLVPNELAPNEFFYSADVFLTNGPITSYGEKIPNVQQIVGTAEILTDDLSLLIRFFNPLRAIFDERLKEQ